MHSNRKIIHIDMDAFFASVEQLDNPELKGKPVIVGGQPHNRGVVAACSYEARKFGIHSAMPSSRASQLCPEAVFLTPRLDRYRELSAAIMDIFKLYTDEIEPLSLDEAFLDITSNKKNQPSATLIARDICSTIHRSTGLTASAGVSCNKFVAKIASDLNKPNGITVITPDMVLDFLAGLPIGKFHGVGKVTESKMLALGIKTGADLRTLSRQELCDHFGKVGSFFFDIVRGHDHRAVKPSRIRKSIGAERTLSEDTRDLPAISALLAELAERVSSTLSRKNTACKTLTLKVRYADFSTITRSLTSSQPVTDPQEILRIAEHLLKHTAAGEQKIRLVGITAANLLIEEKCQRPRQLSLPFPGPLQQRHQPLPAAGTTAMSIAS